MKQNDDLRIDSLQLPNIPISIRRMGNTLKLRAGTYQLELKEIEGRNQVYPLLLLDKFISDVAVKLLKDEIDKRENKAAAKTSLQMLGVGNTDEAADNVIRQIHEDQFGGQE